MATKAKADNATTSTIPGNAVSAVSISISRNKKVQTTINPNKEGVVR
jgi:hypothetical protein